MTITVKRIAKRSTYTIGKLYIDGVYFCDTLENPVRDKKVYGETAIPAGTYKVTLNVVSPRFKDRAWAKLYGGKLPRLLDVPQFDGVLIHPGNTSADTHGCILVGKNKVVGKVVESQAVFHSLMTKLKGQDITISIA